MEKHSDAHAVGTAAVTMSTSNTRCDDAAGALQVRAGTSGNLETWEPGDLPGGVGPAHAQSGRRTARINPDRS